MGLVDCPDFDGDAAYGEIDFLLDSLPEVVEVSSLAQQIS